MKVLLLPLLFQPMTAQRPKESEFNPYYKDYIDLVPNGELNALLTQNLEDCMQI